MVRARRLPRASAEDLYKTCKHAGTCPDDVINKIEGKTTADKILQIGGAAVFFGGLGIGTGSGRGGATGYTPLGGRTGTGVTVGTGTRVVRPPVPVDAVGATDVLPVDALGPSIVPLQEVPPEIPLLEVTPDVPGVPEVPLRVPLDTSGSSVDSGPVTVTVHAVIEPVPSDPPVRTSVSWSQHSNPAFEVIPSSNNSLGETSASSNIFVTHENGGVEIGSSDPAVFREFITSTPRDTPVRVSGPRRGGYPRRFIEQVELSDLSAVVDPGPRVVFGYDNPAYDTTLEFEPPPYPAVRSAPDQRFRDVLRLSAPRYDLSESGHVRVGRHGIRGAVTTRSGVQLGSQAHFHHELSTLTMPEEVELTVLGEQSGTTVIVSGGSESSMEVVSLDTSSFTSIQMSPADLEELLGGIEDVPNFENLRLEFPRGRNRVTLDLPTTNLAMPGPIDVGGGTVYVDYPPADGGGPYGPFGPLPPVIIVDVASGAGTDYYLHPSLQARRRRRRRRHFM
ncbi:L2 [Canis familiaris papillomavirus 9]|uniref:Minor capsid protein L2 n=1 Tax=Canis familiaris papillomavirus 9 TaxID=1087108 RepID=G4XF67_9PAPI|nr:L2 [Canis familiaris papillomavirus 9]AEP82739.1 L2 [Canis familiaris papillomavirus 9]